MATLKKILESTVRIHYQDCDPFNHLNNSKYIDYIVAARTEQLLEPKKMDWAGLPHKHKYHTYILRYGSKKY